MTGDRIEQFNTSGRFGPTCPVCWRMDSLTGDLRNGATLECTGGMAPGRSGDLTRGGCCARFTFSAPNTLTRIGTPDIIRPLTPDELDRVRGGAPSIVEQENAGAREADDLCCPSCGARGYRYICPTCASDMGAA